jgi:hypothetical protein
MNQVFFSNPMAQKLHEAKVSVTKKDETENGFIPQNETESQIEEAKDSNGDTWKLLKNVVRSDKHPHQSKAHVYTKGIPMNVWHNTRTGEVHEGSMEHHPSHGFTPSRDWDDGGRFPRIFHISHYSKHHSKHVKEGTEVDEAGKVHGTGGYWSKANGKPKYIPYKSYEESGREERVKRAKRDWELHDANAAKKEETELDEIAGVKTVSTKGYSGSKPQKPQYRKGTKGFVNYKAGQPAGDADRKVLAFHKDEAAKAGKVVQLRYRGPRSHEGRHTYNPAQSQIRGAATGAAVYYKDKWELGGRQRRKHYEAKRKARDEAKGNIVKR